MYTAMITGKTNIPEFAHVFKKLQHELKELNINSFVVDSGKFTDKPFDIIFSIGGDGHFISVARRFAQFDKPILGINAGTLGFLPNIEPENIKEKLAEYLSQNTQWTKRMLLCGQSSSENKLSALNEFLFTNNRKGILTEFSVYINDEPIMKMRSDGILIATPTGSTAYNLSAGGPIAMPDMQLIMITPVCSHILGERPLVVSTDYSIKIVNHCLQEAAIWADGQESIPLLPQESFFITDISYIKSQPVSSKEFFNTLSKKLGWHLGNFKN
ncbi:MAG: NAD(+)/NADH kinase [Brevinemataceae bacterium]